MNKSMYILNQLIPLLDQAEKAGIDVSVIRARRDELYGQSVAIKAAYFPADE